MNAEHTRTPSEKNRKESREAQRAMWKVYSLLKEYDKEREEHGKPTDCVLMALRTLVSHRRNQSIRDRSRSAAGSLADLQNFHLGSVLQIVFHSNRDKALDANAPVPIDSATKSPTRRHGQLLNFQCTLRYINNRHSFSTRSFTTSEES